MYNFELIADLTGGAGSCTDNFGLFYVTGEKAYPGISFISFNELVWFIAGVYLFVF